MRVVILSLIFSGAVHWSAFAAEPVKLQLTSWARVDPDVQLSFERDEQGRVFVRRDGGPPRNVPIDGFALELLRFNRRVYAIVRSPDSRVPTGKMLVELTPEVMDASLVGRGRDWVAPWARTRRHVMPSAPGLTTLIVDERLFTRWNGVPRAYSHDLRDASGRVKEIFLRARGGAVTRVSKLRRPLSTVRCDLRLDGHEAVQPSPRAVAEIPHGIPNRWSGY